MKRRGSWAYEGLKVYWEGTYPVERLDQFYAVMFQDAEDSAFPYLAESMLRPHHRYPHKSRENGMLKNPLREGMAAPKNWQIF